MSVSPHAQKWSAYEESNLNCRFRKSPPCPLDDRLMVTWTGFEPAITGVKIR